MAVRLSKVIRELNVGISTAVEFLQKKGFGTVEADSNTKITDENIEYYLGTSDIEYEEALASESATGSIAHSVVLVRTKKNANIEQIKQKIKENSCYRC